MVTGADSTAAADTGLGGAPVEIIGLKKRFGSVTAVAGVSLHVAAGEFLALLGPSGSGKTTILNLVAGFDQPDEGEILIDGREVSSLAASKRNLGMVFQRYALFPHMTVAENIGFPLRMRGIGAAGRRRRADELLATVRLEGYGDRRPHQLSGGQQQRVAFARAVAHRPPALLMDEPLAALDKKLREQMQLELKQLQRQLGVTVVLVTHDQTEALTMADRVAVLNHGRLEQIGTPEVLYETPASRFVADFIGETNLLEGTIQQVTDAMATLAAGGTIVRGTIAGTGVAPGVRACAAIRPERISLYSGDDAAIPGRIVQVIFSGASIACHVQAPGGLELVVRIPSAHAAGNRPAAGQAVRLGWSPADVRIYPGSAAP